MAVAQKEGVEVTVPPRASEAVASGVVVAVKEGVRVALALGVREAEAEGEGVVEGLRVAEVQALPPPPEDAVVLGDGDWLRVPLGDPLALGVPVSAALTVACKVGLWEAEGELVRLPSSAPVALPVLLGLPVGVPETLALREARGDAVGAVEALSEAEAVGLHVAVTEGLTCAVGVGAAEGVGAAAVGEGVAVDRGGEALEVRVAAGVTEVVKVGERVGEVVMQEVREAVGQDVRLPRPVELTLGLPVALGVGATVPVTEAEELTVLQVLALKDALEETAAEEDTEVVMDALGVGVAVRVMPPSKSPPVGEGVALLAAELLADMLPQCVAEALSVPLCVPVTLPLEQAEGDTVPEKVEVMQDVGESVADTLSLAAPLPLAQ